MLYKVIIVKPILILVCLSQFVLATTYQYKDSVIKELIRGCANGGGTKSFCICQAKVVMHNVPQTELIGFNKSMHKLYSNPNSQITIQHLNWIQKLVDKCKGL